MKLTLAGNVTTTPEDHVAYFAGEFPCHQDGSPITRIQHSSERKTLVDDLTVDHMFSGKRIDRPYLDYHDKVTTYAAIISGPAQAIDAQTTARTFPVIEGDAEESVFCYIDNASSRAEIDVINAKLALDRIAIVGLGGTGSYILDLVAKTVVREIHLFDADKFLQHNAFRAPGAASLAELTAKPTKVSYLHQIYARLRRGIVAHPTNIDESNVDDLRTMNFVFLSLDPGPARRLLVTKLQEFGVPFIDVGAGVYETGGALAGLLRVTTSSASKSDHVLAKIPFSEHEGADEYSRNIQIADLNALNAALAVIRWKRLFGFYQDLEREHFSVYEIDGNHLLNEDSA